MVDFPNVLMISAEVPETGSAGGLLLYRLFRDYPPNRLFFIGKDVQATVEKLQSTYEVLHTRWSKFEHSRLNRVHRTMRAYGLVPPISARQIDPLLKQFKPDVILTVMEHGSYYDVAWNYAKTRKLPLVVLVHDTNEVFDPVYPWAQEAARRRDGNFYRYASARLCVSVEMEQLLCQLYKVSGSVMFPNRSEELRPRDFEIARELKNPETLTVGFAGNLNYGYGEQLLRMLPAFQQLGARLILYGPMPGGIAKTLLAAEDTVDYRGFLPSTEVWLRIQQECDAVIQPYLNPPDYMAILYSHHFPSKLSEYLALGMPVMIFGPELATGVKWGLSHPEAVLVCTSTSLTTQADILQTLRDDPELRLRLARNSWTAGLADFDPVKIRTNFLKCLRNVSSRRVERGVV